jgi:hypothetical protein
MLRGDLKFSPRAASLLSGVPWKRLNDEFRRDYDRAVEHVLEGIVKEGGDRREVEVEVDRIMAQVVGLRLEKFSPGKRLPKAPGSDSQPGPA